MGADACGVPMQGWLCSASPALPHKRDPRMLRVPRIRASGLSDAQAGSRRSAGAACTQLAARSIAGSQKPLTRGCGLLPRFASQPLVA